MVNIVRAKRGLRFAWKIPPWVRIFFLFSLSFFKFRQAVSQLYLTSTFSFVMNSFNERRRENSSVKLLPSDLSNLSVANKKNLRKQEEKRFFVYSFLTFWNP